jgi:putative ABC transport system permease protein
MVSSLFWDSIQEVIFVQFRQVQRDDITVSFVEPTSGRARHELARLPGVTRAEGFRSVGVRLRFGHRSYRTGILGLEPGAALRRVLDERLAPCPLPADGLVLTAFLGREILGLREGDRVTVEVLEGERRVREVPVVRLVEEYLGVSGYMTLPALNRLLGEGHAISGAHLTVDPGAEAAVFRALDARPGVAGSIARRSALKNFQSTMAEQMLTFALFNTILASSIALGVVYNAARIALAERGRELASLRVLGLTRGEISWILLGELGLVTLLAIPLGWLVGLGLCAYMSTTWQIDLFRMPFAVEPRTFAFAATVVLLAAGGSSLLVRRKLDHLDLVAVLKTRE